MEFKFIQHTYGLSLIVDVGHIDFPLMYLEEGDLDRLEQAIKDFKHDQQRNEWMKEIYAAVDRGEKPKCPECQIEMLADYCADGWTEVPCWACPEGCDEMWFPR